MDYNKLKTFVKVAELQSVSLAARRLRRSQSAISQQIQILENELELKLLERRNSKIYLSPDGEAIYEMARARLGEIDEKINDLKNTRSQVEGHIRLGAHHNYSTDFAAGKIISQFCQRHPNVTFDISDGSSDTIENDLLNNNLDLGFIVVFQHPEMFVRQLVSKSLHRLCVSKQYLRSMGTIKNPRDILNKNLIDLTDDFVCISAFLSKRSKQLVTALRHRKPNIIAPSFEIVKHIVVSGYGIGMLPSFMVEKEIRKGSLVELLPSNKHFYAGLDIAYRTNRTLRLCEKMFLEFLLSHTKKTPL